MRKYGNVDVIAALGAVVELNTEHYKSDFGYDVEMFKDAAIRPDGEYNRLLWLSRQNGTECFAERDVYLIQSQAHNSWTYYADSRTENIRAYAVEITGLAGGRVMGNLQELDYRQHIAEVKKNALNVETVSVKYKDGTALNMPYKTWDGQRDRLFHQHGEIVAIRREPGDENLLRATLKTARETRAKEARPAAFKVRVQNPKPRKPGIKEDIAAGKAQLAREHTAAPARAKAATQTKNREEL